MMPPRCRQEYWTPEQIGVVAYRVAEKVSLLYFLKNSDAILAKAYDASISEMPNDPRDNIFESPQSWKKFKTKYFKKLGGQSKHFLYPWLNELDRIAEEISGPQPRTQARKLRMYRSIPKNIAMKFSGIMHRLRFER